MELIDDRRKQLMFCSSISRFRRAVFTSSNLVITCVLYLGDEIRRGVMLQDGRFQCASLEFRKLEILATVDSKSHRSLLVANDPISAAYKQLI